MYKKGCLLFLYAETPLHPGGDSGVGAIDQPVQREAGTGLPVHHGSGIKGALRDAARERLGINDLHRQIASLEAQRETLREKARADDSPAEFEQLGTKLEERRDRLEAELRSSGISAVFGPETSGADHAGAISVVDGRVLLFPVRSLVGTFAWVTSPLALSRLRRDLIGLNGNLDWDFPPPEPNQAVVPEGSDVCLEDEHLVLDEYTFAVRREPKLAALAHWLAAHALPHDGSYDYWRTRLCGTTDATEEGESCHCKASNLVVLTDDDFRDFCQFATEIQTRHKRNPATKTVDGTGLWTEEHLPAETVLYARVLAADPRMPHAGADDGDGDGDGEIADAGDVIGFVTAFDGELVQMGGDATVGRGLVRIRALLQSSAPAKAGTTTRTSPESGTNAYGGEANGD